MSAPTQAEMAAWPAPNYVNPPTLKTATIAVVTIATATMLPVVVSRLYFRMRLKGRLGIDDFLITIAAVSNALKFHGADREAAFDHIHDSCHICNEPWSWIPSLGHKTRVDPLVQKGEQRFLSGCG
jgi:hypothetical protein